MTSPSIYSESPGSEMSDAQPSIENASYFSFPFSVLRNQRASAAGLTQTSSLVGDRQKSVQERIPSFKAMLGLPSLKEEYGRNKPSSNLGSTAHHSKASSLSFFPEEGATLVWRDLTVTLGDRRDGVSNSKAVHGVTGYARPGTMLTIMSPPGSGNSTLLRALAGKLPNHAKVYGEILRNGLPQQLKPGSYAFVTKDEFLTETLTVRETLFYAVLLQLPDRLSISEKISRVDTLITDLDLEDLAGARVGKCGESGGLSIGKRRRVNLALQLLTKPRLIFADNPLYMLDSVSAYVVMGMLKRLSNMGCTVVTSLEQMSSDIFHLLDKVCLLSSGKTVFFGPAPAAVEHYANAGIVCPATYNPSDHLLRCINTEYDRLNAPGRFGQDSEHGDMWGEMDTDVIIRTLESLYQSSGDAAVVQSMVNHLSEKEKTVLPKQTQSSQFMRLGVLTWRSFLNMWRDFNYFWLRLILSIFLTLCITTLTSKIGHSYSSVSARVASIFSIVSGVTLMGISGFPSLVKDIEVYLAEREIGYSGVVPFTLGNLLASALFSFITSLICTSVGYFLLGLHSSFSPFVYFMVNLFLCLLTFEGIMLLVASVLPKFLEGMIAVLITQILMIMVAGFYLASGDIPSPVWKYPASYLPFHGYALEGLLQNEYEGIKFTAASSHSKPVTGQVAMDHAYSFPVSNLGKWHILLVLGGMAIAYRVLFCFSLPLCQKLRARRKVH